MTNAEIIVERKKYGSSAMDYTMRVYQKLDEETIMIDGLMKMMVMIDMLVVGMIVLKS
jgi:hypothetical protein